MKLLIKNIALLVHFALFHSLVIIGLVISLSASSFAQAVNTTKPSATLKLSPKQCIALHYGQKCYVDIDVQWSANKKGAYCLFSSQQDLHLACWSEARQGHYAKEIVSNTNVIFYLTEKDDKQRVRLVAAELEMAWVYKKNVRSRLSWRMF
ncbi:DUF3019 domain-containing protein [Microbulbifer spongiae]|uniref:DUF3019 domain-containing protein n=1 Tax=Microbulbifer spongiae TaxID=2944933 RepID=A0ABY9E8B7_9GAMM|nr:DUF3019 domain-containing protein [Microbulbifer sp. MI-G]WKD48566.1 DUF3019 domain-containing protein [Microbulbifer sp. MI-G]